ncbi:hypothetical protein D3C81_2228490 [compost metagenome]
MDFLRAMLRVLPQARPPSPLLGTALAKQFEPVIAAEARVLEALPAQPAVKARLIARRDGRSHVVWVMPVAPVSCVT